MNGNYVEIIMKVKKIAFLRGMQTGVVMTAIIFIVIYLAFG